MRTHYDNLHVPRDADSNTIRLAYRRLSKQYHPDYNPRRDAHQIMQIINRAYEVLSDPQRRAQHDRWIAEQEMLEQQRMQSTSRTRLTVSVAHHHTHPRTPTIFRLPEKRRQLSRLILGICATLTVLLAWQIGRILYMPHYSQAIASEPTAAAHETQTLPENPPTTTAYIRPNTAPNGIAFPQDSNYLDGYHQTHFADGHYQLYVENIRNSSDVFAQLRAANQPTVLRTFFLTERSQFLLDGLAQGAYVVDYQQLDDGEKLSSEIMILDDNHREATVYLQRSNAPNLPE